MWVLSKCEFSTNMSSQQMWVLSKCDHCVTTLSMNSVRCDRLLQARMSSSRKSEIKLYDIIYSIKLIILTPYYLKYSTWEEVSRVFEGHKYCLKIMGSSNKIPEGTYLTRGSLATKYKYTSPRVSRYLKTSFPCCSMIVLAQRRLERKGKLEKKADFWHFWHSYVLSTLVWMHSIRE